MKHDLRSALQLGELLMSGGKLVEWQFSEALERQRTLAREELVDAADSETYRAKRSGKNRVSTARREA